MMKPKPLPPGPGQESVWDYPRPPKVESTSRKIEVTFNGEKIAETTRALRVLETAGAPVYYLPPEDIRTAHLSRTGKRSFCEWKGWATYYDLQVGDKTAYSAAWAYHDPTPGYRVIKDHLGFYPGKMDACTLDGEIVRPQPGGFYGGWVTDEIVGPIKGEPGSEHW